MPSVEFHIDFGDPSGTLEELGLEDCTNAQDVLNLLWERQHNVVDALNDWDLLDSGTVTIRFLPDIPEELRMQSVWVAPEEPPPWTPERAAQFERLRQWVAENETRATWSDHGSDRKPLPPLPEKETTDEPD